MCSVLLHGCSTLCRDRLQTVWHCGGCGFDSVVIPLQCVHTPIDSVNIHFNREWVALFRKTAIWDLGFVQRYVDAGVSRVTVSCSVVYDIVYAAMLLIPVFCLFMVVVVGVSDWWLLSLSLF